MNRSLCWPFLKVIQPTFSSILTVGTKLFLYKFSFKSWQSGEKTNKQKNTTTHSYPDAQIKFLGFTQTKPTKHSTDIPVQKLNKCLCQLECLQRQSKKLLSCQFDSEVPRKAREDSPPTASKAKIEQSQRRPQKHKANCRTRAPGQCMYFQI